MNINKSIAFGAILFASSVLAVQAADSKAPAPKLDGLNKPAAVAKEGGEKGDKGGGKVKMQGGTLSKNDNSGGGGKTPDHDNKGGGKLTGTTMHKDGGEKGGKGGGKDKMGMSTLSKGHDNDNKGGGKVKMTGSAMHKDGGDKGGKGPGKDKMGAGINQNMNQMKQSQGAMQR